MRARDDRCGKAAGWMDEAAFERLCDEEEAKVDAIRVAARCCAFFAAAFSALAASRSWPAAKRSAAAFSSSGGLARSCSSAFCFAAAAWAARS